MRAKASRVNAPTRMRLSLSLINTGVIVFSSSNSIRRYDSVSSSSPLAVVTFLLATLGSFSSSLRFLGIVVNVAPVSIKESVVMLLFVVGLVNLTLT